MKIQLITFAGFLGLVAPLWAAPLSGKVVDESRKPVAGAKVRVFPFTNGKSESQELITDEQGAFTANFPDAPRLTRGGITLNLASVSVAAPGFAFSQFAWKEAGDIFTLLPGQEWTGTVLDENEKPVEGVRVAIDSYRVDGKPTYLGSDALTDRTGSDGRWKIGSLPRRGGASVVLSDPRFETRHFDLPLGQSAPPLFVRPGATIKGRLLQPDGTPIAGAPVDGDDAGTVRTDAEGRFTLNGFGMGNTRLRSFDFPSSWGEKDVPAAYIVTSREVEGLKAGETRDIGDWMTQSGILVTGRVVDKSTKKPIAGAQVWISDRGASSMSHNTDAMGRYQVRLSNAGASSAGFSDPNYLSHHLNGLAIPKGVANFEIPTIELEPGVKITGVARLETGLPAQNFGLTANSTGGGQSEVARDQGEGKFSFDGLAPGQYKLTAGLPAYYGEEVPRYELVSPLTFTASSVGQTPVLNVVLKPAKGAEAASKPIGLAGRVVDASGRGIAGAVVSIKDGNYTNPLLAVAGEDGTYQLSDLAPDAKLSLVGIERPGYVASTQPKIERDGQNYRVANWSMKRRGARFGGRVVDAAGNPVGGAWVAPLEVSATAPTQTAPDGTFSFLDLPAGQLTFLAAKGRDSATLATQADAKGIELKLAPPAPIDTGALVDKWLARGGGYWVMGDFDSDLGVERLEKLALSGTTSDQLDERRAQIFSWFIVAAAKHEPAWTGQNAARLLGRLPAGDSKSEAETALALLRAQSTDADDRQIATQWLETEKARAGDMSAATVSRYLEMARIADALKRPDAKALLDFAAQIGDQVSDAQRLQNAMSWGQQVAPLGEAALGDLIEAWKPQAQLAAWSGAANEWADAGQIDSARRALKSAETLAATPAIKAMGANETGYRNTSTTPDLLVQNARGALVRALSERDPAAALKESAAIEEDFAHQNALLWVANGARYRGDNATATQALNKVFEFRIGNTEPFALAAWYGAQIDPALGDELFARARAKIERSSLPANASSLGDIAYYLARLDPAQSRVLIEREWSARTASFAQKKDRFGEANPNSAGTKLVRAMLVIDAARGAQMATQLESVEVGVPDTGGSRGRQRRGWISALTDNPAAQARGDLNE